jgi:hypothetical protein
MSRDAGSIIGFRPKNSISTRIQQTIVSAYMYFLFTMPFFDSEKFPLASCNCWCRGMIQVRRLLVAVPQMFRTFLLYSSQHLFHGIETCNMLYEQKVEQEK